MNKFSKQRGFNLIELLFAILVMAITVNYATPAVQTFMEKNQLKQAAERIYHFYRYSRSESIKQNSQLYVLYNGNGSNTWSFGLVNDNTCDAANLLTDNKCVINDDQGNDVRKVVVNGNVGTGYPQVRMSLQDSGGNAVTNLHLGLDPVRGTSDAGGILLATPNGWSLKNTITPLGEIETCIPSGAPAIVGYRPCA